MLHLERRLVVFCSQSLEVLFFDLFTFQAVPAANRYFHPPGESSRGTLSRVDVLP